MADKRRVVGEIADLMLFILSLPVWIIAAAWKTYNHLRDSEDSNG